MPGRLLCAKTHQSGNLPGIYCQESFSLPDHEELVRILIVFLILTMFLAGMVIYFGKVK